MGFSDIEKFLSSTFPTEMGMGDKVRLTFINGFELFNTRPYHNYETWSDGWVAECADVIVAEESLEAAIMKLGTVKKCDHSPPPEDPKHLYYCSKCRAMKATDGRWHHASEKPYGHWVKWQGEEVVKVVKAAADHLTGASEE